MTATAGTAGSVTLASGLTLSATGAVVSAAVAGAATSVVSGMVNDNLTFKGVLQGALAGALTAGLTGQATELGKAASSMGPVGTIALNTTVQGGIQALLGGSFKDGAIAGFASGLAGLAGASIGGGIDKAVKEGTMSAAEAFAARTLARVFTSAVKALGNPDDPNHGFASALVNEVVGQAMGPAPAAGATPPAATPDAPVPTPTPAPAVEAPPADEAAPPATAPGPDVPVPEPAPAPAPAPAAEAPTAPPPSDPFLTISDADDRTLAEQIADQVGVPRDEIVDAGLRDEAQRSAEVARGFIEGAGFSVLGTGEALLEIARSPRQFINGVKLLLTSPEARAQFGDEIVTRAKVDIQMLEDAFNSGDMRGTGQQLGKLTTDLAQLAGGVDALARFGVSAASAGGRLLLRSVDDLAATRLISTGIQWGKGIEAQGMPWEDYLATTLPAETRLPPKFKTFDFFDVETGVATSAKTLDTTTPAKVANPSQVYSSLKGNIDAVANFEGVERLSGATVDAAKIATRVVEIAVPESTTAAQWDQIAKAIQYAQSRGVVVKITKIKS
jgi:hypothetical protein